MVHMRYADTGVAEVSIAYHACSEQLHQRRASRMSLVSRDFFGRVLTAQRGAQSVDEMLVTKQDLPLQFLPRGRHLRTLRYESSAPSLRAGALPAELGQYPLDGE